MPRVILFPKVKAYHLASTYLSLLFHIFNVILQKLKGANLATLESSKHYC